MERFYPGCLWPAHPKTAGSASVAAIIDPQRDVDFSLEASARNGLTIEHIPETHLHAGFVSGRRGLAERAGADLSQRRQA